MSKLSSTQLMNASTPLRLRRPIVFLNPELVLTGPQGRGCDFDLAGSLVGLEGGGPASSTEVCSKQVWALGPRGAGAGAVSSMMGLLLVIHRDQLQEGRQKDAGLEADVAVRSRKGTRRSRSD